MIDIKKGDKITIAGLHKLPDGSFRFGKKHKRNRADKTPDLIVTDASGIESKIEVSM